MVFPDPDLEKTFTRFWQQDASQILRNKSAVLSSLTPSKDYSHISIGPNWGICFHLRAMLSLSGRKE